MALPRLKQVDAIAAAVEYARWLGIVDLVILRCGCIKVRFRSGRSRRIRCAAHPYHAPKVQMVVDSYPKDCECGYCKRLCEESAKAHRLGDEDTCKRLRRQRIEHWRRGCRSTPAAAAV